MATVQKLVNTFIDKRDIDYLSSRTQDLKVFDSNLNARLSEDGIDGLKVWEYGKLLTSISDFRSMRVLDAGPGESTFCIYLKSLGADVTTIDYPQPFAPDKEGFRNKCQRHDVAIQFGSMTHMPYKSASFDLVTCTSSIEHLDTDQKWKPIAHDKFIEATFNTLAEMCRIVRPGGYLYITSDAYDPERQKTDNWELSFMYNGIGAAYSICDIERIFVDTIEKSGLTFVNGCDYDPDIVVRDPQRCNYRGRYFTTFAILAKK
jgi:SAM-dependent methyltransferase